MHTLMQKIALSSVYIFCVEICKYIIFTIYNNTQCAIHSGIITSHIRFVCEMRVTMEGSWIISKLVRVYYKSSNHDCVVLGRIFA
jgi:hypothetical protein